VSVTWKRGIKRHLKRGEASVEKGPRDQRELRVGGPGFCSLTIFPGKAWSPEGATEEELGNLKRESTLRGCCGGVGGWGVGKTKGKEA